MLLWCPSHLQIVICTRTFNHNNTWRRTIQLNFQSPVIWSLCNFWQSWSHVSWNVFLFLRQALAIWLRRLWLFCSDHCGERVAVLKANILGTCDPRHRALARFPAEACHQGSETNEVEGKERVDGGDVIGMSLKAASWAPPCQGGRQLCSWLGSAGGHLHTSSSQASTWKQHRQGEVPSPTFRFRRKRIGERLMKF